MVNDFSYARMTMTFDGAPFSLERSLDTITFSSVPEPGTGLLLGASILVALTTRRRHLG